MSKESNGLASAILGNYPLPPSDLLLKMNRRTKHAAQFAEVSKANTEVVEELIRLTEKLSGSGKDTEARKVIDIIKRLLENNHKLQQAVGNALRDI